MTTFISLFTAESMTGLSRRTLWRRVGEGVLHTETAQVEPGDAARVDVDEVIKLSALRLEHADRALIVDADRGVAAAQCDLGLLLLTLPGGGQSPLAVKWFERAARQAYPEAMYWLGRLQVAGTGCAPNERGGIDWIARAANQGHVIARAMVAYIYDAARPAQTPVELDAALEVIERRVVLGRLEETADR